MDKRKIGVFDSGIGGLTVVRSLFEYLPNERLVYFGDSLNVPYGNGNRTKAEIYRLAARIVEFLKSKDVKAIAVACNTVSSLCIDEIRELTDIPIIDVLTPGAVAVASAAKKGVGIIATRGTTQSGAHERIIRKENPDIAVYAQACPLLAPIVEEGLYETDIAYAAVKHYLSGFDAEKIDSILLGCTHYPLLGNALRKVTDIPLADPAMYIAEELKTRLTDINALALSDSGSVEHEFFTSGDTNEFDEHIRRILGFNPKAKRVLY